MAWKKETVKAGSLYNREWLGTAAGIQYKEKSAVYRKQWRKDNKEKFKATQRRSYEAIRLECFQHYSGKEIPDCRCCSETILEFLHLDHVDADGADHRRRLKANTGRTILGGTALYYWLKKNGWPNDPRFQVLCANCNLGKRIGKYCPHELRRGTDMDGQPIPAEYYPSEFNWMPQEKGPERDVWLASPQGMAYKEKQAAAKRGKPSKKKQPKVNLNCTQCGASLQRKQCEIEGNRRRSKDGVERFFCNMKCAGAWKSANLKGDKIYNFGKQKDKPRRELALFSAT